MHPVIGWFCSLCAAVSIGTGPGTSPTPADANVYYNGQKIGVYVDDQNPDQCAVVYNELLEHPDWVVIAGIPMGNNYRCSPGKAFNLLEWYPFPSGWGSSYQPPCNKDGYILPWSFHWDGTPPYTFTQITTLYKNALNCNPGTVIFF